MTLDQMNDPADTCIRELRSVAPRRKVAASHSSTSNTSMKSPSSESPSQAVGASIRIGLTVDDIKQAFRDNLVCGMGRLEAVATKHDLYFALALTVRDRLFHRSVASIENYGRADARYVAYLSAEFLLGPHLANNLLNLGITEVAREAMSGLGYDLDEILAQEEEPGLGNGGLGRLAACYMDSLASVEVPALGYGIRHIDPAVRDRLKVVFIPNFNVKNAHFIYPAADLSEQISTAGKEASGTGNMKFSLNGALTIGTLDGANVEIRDEVGTENFFLFGLTAAEVTEVKTRGYRPRDYCNQNATLREVIDFIASGTLGSGDTELFRPIVENLLNHDPFLLLADYQAYVDAQDRVSALWRDPHAWTRQSILNSARMGKFSSDRSIRDYCQRVWRVQPGLANP